MDDKLFNIVEVRYLFLHYDKAPHYMNAQFDHIYLSEYQGKYRLKEMLSLRLRKSFLHPNMTVYNNELCLYNNEQYLNMIVLIYLDKK